MWGCSLDDSDEIFGQEQLQATVQGRWIHAPSLAEFVRRDKEHIGPGIGATILDGKSCLRKIESDAEEILFGDR